MQNWIEIHFTLDSLDTQTEELLFSIFHEFCEGIEEVEGRDGKVIKSYFPATATGRRELQSLKSNLRTVFKNRSMDSSVLNERLKTTILKNTDWATNWKEFYKQKRVGEHFIISPSWEQPTVGKKDILITLDPGQAFGTGQHESTRLCLEVLEKIDIAGQKVADVGCGSGVLSIAAAKMGADEVWGCDIDQNSIEATIENAQLNGVGHIISIEKGSTGVLKPNKPFGLVFANIIADVLLSIGDSLVSLMKQDGYMIWSGIIQEKAEVIESYLNKNQLRIVHKVQMGEWIAYLLKLNKAILN